MCYKFTEQQRAESRARIGAGTRHQQLALPLAGHHRGCCSIPALDCLSQSHLDPSNQSALRFRSMEAWSKAYYWTGETLSQLSLVLTSWAAAEALREADPYPPSLPISLSLTKASSYFLSFLSLFLLALLVPLILLAARG